MDIDWITIGLQTVNVLILLWLLQHFLYQPVLAVLDRRREAIEARVSSADAARHEAEAAKAAAEQERAALATQRDTAERRLRTEMEAARSRELHRFTAEGEQLLQTARRRIDDERREAEARLREDAVALAGDFARQILRRVPNALLLRAYLDELCADPNSLRGAAHPSLRIVTARPLSESEGGLLVERLGQVLEGPLQCSFEVDERLIAGLELHFADRVVAHSVAQDLARLQEAAGGHDQAD